jgi:hypothetical protein
MIGEFEMIWEEAVVKQWKYYPDIYLEGLRKTTIKLSEDSRCSYRHSNRKPPEEKS